MAPFREFNKPQQRQRYIKKGHIHSSKALKKRADEWIEKWSSVSGVPNRVFKDHSLNDGGLEMSVDEHSYSLSPEFVKAFESKVAHEGITAYYMTRDQIENLEMEENLTTDEEDDDDEERTFTPLPLSFNYIGSKLKLCSLNNKTNSSDTEVGINARSDVASSRLSPNNNVNVDDTASQLSSDENLSPNENNSNKDDCDIDERDPDTERTRPVSRISLIIPLYGDDDGGDDMSDCETERPLSRMSRSGYMSFFETEYEDDDDDDINSKKNFKARKPGQGVYGKIPGVNVGTVWKSRRQFSRRSVHRPQNAIIHGGPKGAYSMVLSASYSVNDRGEEFDFYGEGGRDTKTKKHVRDQRMERGNLSLRENIQTGTPVRVIRGYQLQNMYAPDIGYCYDGLYEVTQLTNRNIDGYKVFMFTFARCGHQQLPPWHTSKFHLPLPSPSSVDHHLSDSDDDIILENERHKKPTRKKRRRTSVPEISRSSTPLSCASDDSPPELHIPENNVECPIVYPIPPRLSPSLSINNGVLDIQKRPVLLLQKLDKSIIAEAVVKPVNVKDLRFFQQNLKKMKSKQQHGMEILKKKRKYTFKKNKIPTVNANILKKENKKIKSVTRRVVTTAKINLNKKRGRPKIIPVTKKNNSKSDVEIKKKRGRPKIILETKKNTSESDVGIKKKRGRPKMSLIKKTNVNGPLRKVSTKKDLPINEPVNKKRGRPKNVVNDVKDIKTKKHDVAFTQKKTTANKTNEKKKIILKKDSNTQGKKSELPHSYPGKKRGRKRKNTE